MKFRHFSTTFFFFLNYHLPQRPLSSSPTTMQPAKMQAQATANCRRLATLLILSCIAASWVAVEPLVPARYDGFVYRGGGVDLAESIVVEAFFDPICPDSRDAWPPLERALRHYSGRVSLIVHPFALPYHDNSFAACRALHIANKMNASATYPLMELFFKYQEKFYNRQTYHLSRATVITDIIELMASAIGDASLADIESGFQLSQSDMATRISFKYGCSRGVTGTPFFFVNGFPLPDPGSAIDYNGWRSILDHLDDQNQRASSKDSLYDFL